MEFQVQLPQNGYRFAGKLKTRSASEIHTSNWTLGCETLDRDFANYHEYKEYLVPLGIKTLRFQGGWAKTEQERGIYNFSWLDEIINDACSRGLNVLLETDYGNPIYPGGGGWDLGGGFPVSAEALAAWDRWVEAMALRNKDKVRDWAMWNEPDNKNHTPEMIADFNIRTAEIIRQIIPDARIAGLSLARTDPWFLEQCLQRIKDAGKEQLFTWFIYHGYCANPDQSYFHVEELKATLKRLIPHARMRQGENGCPSERVEKFALSGYPWTELSQAKWDLRRMLGDLGHDVESAIFTICDFNHVGREINRKGLLRADASHKVLGPKLAYSAVRNLTAIFDDRLERIGNGTASLIYEKDTSLFVYREKSTGNLLLNWWDCSGIPSEERKAKPGQLILYKETVADPVWVDLVSGMVWEIPLETVSVSGDFTIFHNIPVYDSPVVLTKKSFLE